MIVPPTEGLRVARYAQGAGYSPEQWARGLAGVDWSRAELLSDKPGSSVWRATLVVQKRPQALVIKCEPIDSLKRRLQMLFGKTHAHRHWRGAELLTRHGFRTAEPKAIVYGRRDGVTVECLIMEALDGRTVLEHLAAGDLGVREEHAVARACGALAWELESKAPNPDLKLSNLIVLEPGGRRAAIAMIDCVGVGRRADHIDMLAIQCIEAAGLGLLPRRALLMRALVSGAGERGDSGSRRRHHDRIGAWWSAVRARIEAHGDLAPEHDPLAHPGRLETGPTGGRGGVV